MQSIRLKIVGIRDANEFSANIKVIGIGNIGNRIVDLLNLDKKLESYIVNNFNIEKNLEKKLKNTDLLFITTGLEEKYTEEIVSFIARVAKKMNIFTIVAVPLQMPLKKHIAFNIAYQRVKNLLSFTDNCIVVTNQSYAVNNLKTNGVFEKIYQILAKTIESIIGVIIEPALICIDFADVITALQNGGLSLVGLGSASGEKKIEEAINRAIKSISLQGKNISDASKLLVVFHSGEDITLKDIDFAMQKIENELSDDNLAVFGAILNPYTDKFEVVIIATGFEKNSYSNSKDLTTFPIIEKLRKALKESSKKKEGDNNLSNGSG